MPAFSKATVFWVLTVVSAISAFVLKPAWTDPVRQVVQISTLLQWPLSSGARDVREMATTAAAPEIPPERAQRLRDKVAELSRQVAQQRERMEQLEAHLAEVTGLRGHLPDSGTVIIPAPVVAYDADPRRAVLRVAITPRARQLIRPGQWVAAGAPRREWDAEVTQTAWELLDQQWLIGRVERVHTRVATVRLTTDPGFRTEVRAARVRADGTWELAEAGCVLSGLGAGRLLVSQAPADYFAAGYRILVVPAGRGLPSPLSVGRVVAAVARDDSAQHFDLRVEPWRALDALTHVYVISLGPEGD
jgi:hypothetical protein